jgi:uncharacterized protein (TIGR03435 family)
MTRLPLLLLLAAAAGAQTTGPRFEAVSIHELEGPYRVLGQLTVSGSLVRLEGYTVGMLVAEAYGKKRYQTATPSPKHFAYFSVNARAPGDAAPARPVLQTMLQNMLADRFHLKAHKEMRSVPVYELVVDKSGPHRNSSDSSQDCYQLTGPVTPTDRNYRYMVKNCSMDRFAEGLNADRPVLNRTNLTGFYDISIFYTPDFRMQNEVQPTDIAIQDSIRRLGLQMEKRDEPMEIVVVDSYDDLPSAN